MSYRYLLFRSAGADPARSRALAEAVDRRGLPVMVGSDLAVPVLDYQLDEEAVALVVLLGTIHDRQAFEATCAHFRRDASLVLVRLDENGQVPADLADVPHFDLTGAADAVELPRFMGFVDGLWRERPSGPRPWQSLADSTRVARGAVSGLRELTEELRRLQPVLDSDVAAARMLGDTLGEIDATFRVVKESVGRFLAPALDPDRIDGAAYADLAHGDLHQAINNGRAHCGRIRFRYRGVGGLREHIDGRIGTDELARVDQAFGRLATADGDLFAAMDQLGAALTRESGAIVRLMLAGLPGPVRQRVVDFYPELTALEADLDQAMASLQSVERELGYAERRVKGGTVVHEEYHFETHFNGPVTGAVAVGRLDHVRQTVSAATGVSDGLRDLLVQLTAAVGELTAQLPAEDAELAIDDLERLGKEATADEPRTSVLKRAADGLLRAAKSVTDVGVPIVDLVTKIVALVG